MGRRDLRFLVPMVKRGVVVTPAPNGYLNKLWEVEFLLNTKIATQQRNKSNSNKKPPAREKGEKKIWKLAIRDGMFFKICSFRKKLTCQLQGLEQSC